MERPQFITDNIYHVFNRSVERRKIFLDNKDHLRFIHDLFEFNDSAPAANTTRNFYKVISENRPRIPRKPREKLVDILSYSLMPNHYHLMLRQYVDGGITEFMRKLGTGYTNYFNLRYKRIGPLFQGKFKAVHLIREAHFQYLPHYIHLNPLDLLMPEWRVKRIRDTKKALRFLDGYRWSSYLDLTGRKQNFPSLLTMDVFAKLIGSPTSYQSHLIEWIQDMDLVALQDVIFGEYE